MFGLFRKVHRPSAAVSVRRARLGVEALETRCCLSATAAAPQITLAAVPAPGNQVELSGSVVGESPGACVQFNGAAVGSAITDSAGHYDVLLPAGQAGMVYAQAADQLTGALTNTVGVELLPAGTEGPADLVELPAGAAPTSPTPTTTTPTTTTPPTTTTGSSYIHIDYFYASNIMPNVWAFSGHVTANDDPTGLSVSFIGPNSVNGQGTRIQSDGHFYLTVMYQSNEGGMVSAQTWDWDGTPSNVASAMT